MATCLDPPYDSYATQDGRCGIHIFSLGGLLYYFRIITAPLHPQDRAWEKDALSYFCYIHGGYRLATFV